MDCPRCHSQNTATFEMVYSGGTSHGGISGRGFSYDNNLGVHTFSGRTFQQTDLAARTTPPASPSGVKGVLAFVGSFLVLLFGGATVVDGIFEILRYVLPVILLTPLKWAAVLLLLVGAAAGAYFAMNFLTKGDYERYEQELADWRESWVCLRCGTNFYE